MRLVEQLISYLDTTGALTAADLLQLARHGFAELPAGTLDSREEGTHGGNEDPHPGSGPVRQPWGRGQARSLDDYEQDFPGRPSRRRKRDKQAQRRGTPSPAQVLSSWLASEFESWENELTVLPAVAQHSARCTNWNGAVSLIAQTPEDVIADHLDATLRSDRTSVGDIWRAIRFSEYRSRMPELDQTTRNAYEAILSGTEIETILKHAWLLKHKPVATVYQLIQSQLRLLRAFGILCRRQPTLLRRRCPWNGPVMRLLLVLHIANASTGEFQHSVESSLLTFVLPARVSIWSEAFAYGLLADPEAVAPLLAACLEDPFVTIPRGRALQPLAQHAITEGMIEGLEEVVRGKCTRLWWIRFCGVKAESVGETYRALGEVVRNRPPEAAQISAVYCLCRFREKAIEAVSVGLSSAHEGVRRATAHGIGELGPVAMPLLPVLAEALPDVSIQQDVSKVILRLAQSDQELFLQTAAKCWPEQRSPIFACFARAGGRGLSLLFDAVHWRGYVIRRDAILALKDLPAECSHDRRWLEMVVRGLEDVFDSVQQASLSVMGDACPESYRAEIVNLLAKSLCEKPKAQLRAAAAEALGQLDLHATPGYAHLKSALHDESDLVRAAALRAIRATGPVDDALEELAAALMDDAPSVRLAALESLTDIFKQFQHKTEPAADWMPGIETATAHVIHNTQIVMRPIVERSPEGRWIPRYDEETRVLVIRLLEAIGLKAHSAMGDVSAAMRDWTPAVRTAAREVFWRFVTEVVNRSKHTSSREQAPWSLLDAVPTLLAALDDRDQETRRFALRCISALSPGSLWPSGMPAHVCELADNTYRSVARVLTACLIDQRHGDYDFWREIGLTLGTMGEYAEPWSDDLKGLLRSGLDVDAFGRTEEPGSWRIRAAVAYAFHCIGAPASRAVPELVAALSDSSPEVVRESVLALGQMAFAAGPAVPRLIELLDAPLPFEQFPVDLSPLQDDFELEDLARRSPAVPPPLTPSPLDARGRQWLNALIADSLGKIGTSASAAVPALVEILNGAVPKVTLPVPTNWEHDVRNYFAEKLPGFPLLDNLLVDLSTTDSTLDKLLGTETASPFPSAGQFEPSPDSYLDEPETAQQGYWNAQNCVVIALGKIGPAARPAVPILTAIVACLVDPRSKEAARSLGRISPEAAAAGADVLHPFLTAEDPFERSRAVYLSAVIGTSHPAVVSNLVAALDDSVPEIRKWAVLGLERLGLGAADAAAALRQELKDMPELVARALKCLGDATNK